MLDLRNFVRNTKYIVGSGSQYAIALGLLSGLLGPSITPATCLTCLLIRNLSSGLRLLQQRLKQILAYEYLSRYLSGLRILEQMLKRLTNTIFKRLTDIQTDILKRCTKYLSGSQNT